MAIRNAGSRASRYPASVSVPGDTTRTTSRRTRPLAFLRILDLLADGDAKSLADEPGDVAVGGVERHAAHRNRAAAGILRTRGERELERARGGERVLVEHLVEVAHPEKHDGVAVLTLRVEVLPHGRGRPGRFGKDRGGHRSCAGRLGSGEPVGPSITLSRHVLVLALDTTTRSGSAAVVRDGELLGEIVGDESRNARRAVAGRADARPRDGGGLPRRHRSARRRGGTGIVHRAARRHCRDAGAGDGDRSKDRSYLGARSARRRRPADGSGTRGGVDRRAARRGLRVAVRCRRRARRERTVVAPADSDARRRGEMRSPVEPSGSSATGPHDTRQSSASGSARARESCRRRRWPASSAGSRRPRRRARCCLTRSCRSTFGGRTPSLPGPGGPSDADEPGQHGDRAGVRPGGPGRRRPARGGDLHEPVDAGDARQRAAAVRRRARLRGPAARLPGRGVLRLLARLRRAPHQHHRRRREASDGKGWRLP